MSLRIYFDINYSINLHTGIARYSTEIMSRIVSKYTGNKYVGGVCIDKYSIEIRKKFPFKIHIIPFRDSRLFWSTMKYKMSFNRLAHVKADKFVFWANYVPNFPVKGKVITVLHDLNPIYLYKGKELERYLKRIEHTLLVSDRIITVSEYTKADIVKRFQYSEDKISVVYNAVDFCRYSRMIEANEQTHIRNKYNLPEKFFLYIGSTYKSKNIKAILDAITYLPVDVKGKYHFICSNTAEYLVDYAVEKNVSEYVTFLDGVDEEDKAGVFQMANFSLFVSICEGFGLPVIESQASGTPVIVSNISCLPEVAGEEAAILVNPYEPREIAEAIQRIISDNQFRNELIEKGYKNVSRYSWDDSATKFYKVIQEV